LIVAVFNFGAYTDEFEPVIGNSNETQYGIATSLLIIVVILCPLMLFIKPCMAGFADHGEEDDAEIEFTNINRGEGIQEPMIGAEYQAVNGEDSSRKLTNDMMNKRQSQMKDLDR